MTDAILNSYNLGEGSRRICTNCEAWINTRVHNQHGEQIPGKNIL